MSIPDDVFKNVCSNCMDFEIHEDGKFYCGIRFLTKNGKRIGNLPISRDKNACSVFCKKIN